MGERPCTVRKYASTLKTSAILVASLAGLWLGIIGQVSASTESVQVVTARPSAEDCRAAAIEESDSTLVWSWSNLLNRLNDQSPPITLDEFKTAMDKSLTSPDLINCKYLSSGWTLAHSAATKGSIEGAKWAVSKGIDLTILTTNSDNMTAYELALLFSKVGYNNEEERLRFIKVAQILKPPPAEATDSCAEVDGQTPPANEYCIVAENLQSSIETEVSQSLKRLIGVDYIYKAEKYLSGTALYPGYKATITFTCAPGIQDCGPAYVPGDRWSDNFLNLVKRTFGLSVKCSDSGNLLDVDSIEAGESVSVTHSSDTERSSPWYRNCEAISGGPFTLSIKTTRLAQ